MEYEKLKSIDNKEFLRFTGIKRNIFNKAITILKEAKLRKLKKRGRPNKLTLENRLLMALSYWREYRTYFHTGKTFGISETNCYQNIVWIEDVLLNIQIFSNFLGKKNYYRIILQKLHNNVLLPEKKIKEQIFSQETKAK